MIIKRLIPYTELAASRFDPVNFPPRADYLSNYISKLPADIGQMADEFNATALVVNDLEQSAKNSKDLAEAAALVANSASNTKGVFIPGQTNALQNETWIYEGAFWFALTDTSATPQESSGDWASLSKHSSLTNRDEQGAHPASAIDMENGMSLKEEMDIVNPIHVVYGREIGIVGDGVADDTDALELGLNFFDNINKTSVFQKSKNYVLDLSGLKIRYTRRLVQAQGCHMKGDFLQSLRPVSLDESGTILYPDFDAPFQSSIVTACYSLNETVAPVGTLLDPWVATVGSGAYDSAHATRTYGCTIKGVAFYTDRFVGSPYSAIAAPSVVAEYSHTGFLNGGIFMSCWPCNIKIYGNSYHRGVMLYNCNGRTVDGYISRYSDISSAPTLDDTTEPAFVISEDAIHNPDSLRHATCGVYEAFCNGGGVDAIVEGFDTGSFRWQCLGSVDNAPYREKIGLLYHHVASITLTTAPRVVFTGALGRVSSSGLLDIQSPAMQGVGKLDYGSQDSFGIPARMHLTLRSQVQIPDDEKYNPAVSFSFVVPATTIYLDSINGDNTSTGLTLANAVQSLDIALARAEHYDIDSIELVGGDAAELKADYLLTSKIRIYSKQGQATVTPIISGGFIRRIQLGSNADLIIENCSVFLPAGGTSLSARGLFRPVEGSSKVSLLNCETSAGDSFAGLFNSASGNGTHTIFNISGGSVNLNLYGANDFNASGQATIVFSKSGVTELGSLTWESTFKVI